MVIFEEKGTYTFTFDEKEVGEVCYNIEREGYFLKIEEFNNDFERVNVVDLKNNILEEIDETEKVQKCDAHLVVKSRTK